MLSLFETALVAAALFAATNADDLMLLVVFFAQPGCRPGRVLAGQLVGLGVLTGVSFLAAWFALAVPSGWLP